MKNTVQIVLTALAATVLLAGCDRNACKATYDGASGFGFASGVVNVEVSEEDRNSIRIPVARGSEDTDLASIGFEYDISGNNSADPVWAAEDPDGVFSLTTGNVVFAEGAYTAYALIRFNDINKLGVTDKYRMRLTLKDNVSPSGRSQTIVTVSRKLTFEFLSECEYLDACIFEKAYKSNIYKATEAEIYRVEDPYSAGLIEESYAANGWMGSPSEFVEFSVDENGHITYEPFCTGMLVQGQYEAYCYYPSTYIWGKDFSDHDEDNRKLSDTVFQLFPVYCLPDFQYGFINDGAYPITITLTE